MRERIPLGKHLERELKDAVSLNCNANWYAHKKARRLRAGWMCEVIEP